MNEERRHPEGITRTAEFLADSIRKSEEHAVRHGTSGVEAEQEIVSLVREACELFGGDLQDPQWYVGAASLLSALAMLGQGSVGGVFIEPYLGLLSMAMGRVHDDMLKSGATIVFAEGGN